MIFYLLEESQNQDFDPTVLELVIAQQFSNLFSGSSAALICENDKCINRICVQHGIRDDHRRPESASCNDVRGTHFFSCVHTTFCAVYKVRLLQVCVCHQSNKKRNHFWDINIRNDSISVSNFNLWKWNALSYPTVRSHKTYRIIEERPVQRLHGCTLRRYITEDSYHPCSF